MIFRRKKEPEVAPCPSDILAGLVAARMISEPSRFVIQLAGREYGTRMRRGIWSDGRHGIKVVFKTGIHDSWKSSMYGSLEEFSRNGVQLTPTGVGHRQLREAAYQCESHNIQLAQSKAKYEGDMAACDGIADLMGVTA